MVTKVSTSSAATVFAQDPALLAALMLDQPGGNPSAVRSLAELCRQAGALDEARQLYERLVVLTPDDAKARALAEILNRRRSPLPPTPDDAWPAPFICVPDFLPADLHAEIRAMTANALPQFVASEVYREGHLRVDASKRVSSVLPQTQEYLRRVRPYVVAAVDDYDVAGLFGIERSRLNRYELQVTCHGDGAFFKAHTDSVSDRHRLISYVYYFHGAPKRFAGGGLLLYDSAVATDRYDQRAFTRIEPKDNSLVMFPSTAAHEVERVGVESGAMADGRFSVNGWFLEDDG